MHIGLIVGIGPAATDYYYRYLISALARAGRDLTLTMAHADTPTLLRNQSEGNVGAQVEIYRQLTDRLQRSGVEQVAVTSICGSFLHRCLQGDIAGSRNRLARHSTTRGKAAWLQESRAAWNPRGDGDALLWRTRRPGSHPPRQLARGPRGLRFDGQCRDRDLRASGGIHESREDLDRCIWMRVDPLGRYGLGTGVQEG